MKIVHICLSNFYIDGFAYQENELVAQHVRDGHEVTVLASTEVLGKDMRLSYLAPSDYLGADGARVIRLPYRRCLPAWVMRKLRCHPHVMHHLRQLEPDVLLFHGTCGWEVNTVASYRKSNPATKLYVDSHEDFYNSAKTFVSKWLLHYMFYRPVLRRNIESIEKILCVNLAAMDFVAGFYGIPPEKLEFFPLGGNLLSDEEYASFRHQGRDEYHLEPDSVVFLQSGKLDRSKKLVESLRAFTETEGHSCRFLVVGSLHPEIDAEIQTLVANDPRIKLLGWKSPEQLRMLLCASDFYVQPGTQSATMQMALCCRCAVILDDVRSHAPYMDGNGWLVGKETSLAEAFSRAACGPDEICRMSRKSAAIAARLLDYKLLAQRLYR